MSASFTLPNRNRTSIEIFTNSVEIARFQSFSSSMTNKEVLIGFDLPSGFVAITSYGATGRPPSTLPYFFVHTNGQYLLSSYLSDETDVSNILMFFDTVVDLVR